MSYFKNVKVGDDVYGYVYGKGVVNYVLGSTKHVEGFYSFSVMFDNGEEVFYTEDGIPNWCNSAGCLQTVYYIRDIDLISEDFSIAPMDQSLTYKKIMKLRVNNKLEMKCPSGMWRDVSKCPDTVLLGSLTREQFHLFRKKRI